MPRGWIRIIATASTCLLLGAIVNVAVAWACVCWSNQSGQSSSFGEEMEWRAPTPPGWPETAPHWKCATFGLTEYSAMGSDGSLWSVCEQWVQQSGLPLRAMYVARSERKSSVQTFVSTGKVAPASWQDGLLLPEWIGDERFRMNRFLPTQVIWTGFAINSSLYACVLWLISGAPFRLRRRLRNRRGLCPACAYPIGTSPVCTECGEALAVVGVPWSKRGFASAGHASARSVDGSG